MKRRNIALVAFLLAFVAASSIKPVQADDPTIDSIVAAWQKREKETRTLRATISESHVVPKGSTSGFAELAGQPPTDEVLPAKDTTLKRERTLFLDGVKMHHHRVGQGWSVETKGFVVEEMISVSDSVLPMTLQQTTLPSGEKRSIGFIHNNPQHPDRRNLFLGAILLHYRPFNPDLGPLTPEHWSIADGDAKIGERRCVKIRQTGKKNPEYTDLWVDLEYTALVRREDWFDKRISNLLEVSYGPDDNGKIVPKKWSVKRFGNGKSLESADGELKTISLNEDIPESTFKIEFPPGTQVNHYGVGSYVVPAK